jgi:alkanesulfonate monooxygenase SsuD/methylene tetrahydromethanopterin reductase-like flavin-dependent oxidoreductase (luciferase family)
VRIGINVPFRGQDLKYLDGAGVAERARMIEAAGLDGIWLGDHLTVSRPDPLAYLLIAAQATTTVELGTAIYVVPLRERYDLAQRFVTLQTLAPGRFTFGVGTGSAEREYEITGHVFADRFKALREDMRIIRAICDGQPTEMPGAPREGPRWGEEVGRARFALGAWHSDPQLRRAAEDYDGWIASAGGLTRIGGWKNMAESLGYDDVIVHKTDPANPIPGMGYMVDFTTEELEEIRSLMPKDGRPAITASGLEC